MRFQKGILSEEKIRKKIASSEASFAIEGMYFDEQDRKDLWELLSGQKSEEKLIQEVLMRYQL